MSPTPLDEADGRRGVGVIVMAVLASILWLALATAALYLLAIYRLPTSLTEWAGVAAGAAAPLSLIWLVALVATRAKPDALRNMLARIDAAERRLADAAARAHHDIHAIDGMLTSIAARVETMRAAIDRQAAALLDTTSEFETRTTGVSGALARDRAAIEALLARLDTGSTAARRELTDIIEALPQAEARAASFGAALGAGAAETRAQIAEIEDMLAKLRAKNEETQAQAAAAAARLTAAIQAIEAASGTATSSLTAHTDALSASVDSTLARTAQALDAARTGIEAQTSAILGSANQARIVFDNIGGEASRVIAKRLDGLAQQADRLTAQFQAQEANSRNLVEAVERHFGVLDAKLSYASQTSTGVLDRLGERLAAVREQIHELAIPLGGTHEATREIEAAVVALHATTAQAIEVLGQTLPDSISRTNEAVEAIRGSVTAVMADVTQLHTGIAQASGPAEAARVTIETAIADLAAQRDALDTTVSQIAARLTEAKALAAEVDATAGSTALIATTKLVDAMSRVHDVANQAAGAMRATLDGVVHEMRTALAAAGEQTARSAFAEPIKTQLAEIDAASERSAAVGQAAAERLSRQLVSIAETAAAVEAQIADADVRLDDAARDDLARRSSLLIEALNSASIDIAKVLAHEIADPAWAAYLRGDRSVFTRRAVKLLDGRIARAIAKFYDKEPEFRDSVRRYIADFEALMRRVMADRDGSPLSVALLSSDVGKLYVALAQATERLRT